MSATSLCARTLLPYNPLLLMLGLQFRSLCLLRRGDCLMILVLSQTQLLLLSFLLLCQLLFLLLLLLLPLLLPCLVHHRVGRVLLPLLLHPHLLLGLHCVAAVESVVLLGNGGRCSIGNLLLLLRVLEK